MTRLEFLTKALTTSGRSEKEALEWANKNLSKKFIESLNQEVPVSDAIKLLEELSKAPEKVIEETLLHLFS